MKKNFSAEEVSTLQPVQNPRPAGGYTLKKAAAHGEPMQEQDPGRNCDRCMACAGAAHAEVLYCTERMRAGAAGKCAEGVLEI